MRSIVPTFGAMQLGQITTVDVTEFFNKAREKIAPKYMPESTDKNHAKLRADNFSIACFQTFL